MIDVFSAPDGDRVAKPLRVLCVSTWPAGSAPAVRFRCEAYIKPLSTRDIYVDLWSFFEYKTYLGLKDGSIYSRISAFFMSPIRVFSLFLRIKHYHVIWLLREAAPIGPPWIELVVGRLFRKNIVYEFDDAIWMSPHRESFSTRVLRHRSKVVTNLRLARHVIAGNTFLADFASRHSKNVTILPTCVDVVGKFKFPTAQAGKKHTIIGWTGSNSTNRYLALMNGVFSEMRNRHEFEIQIISDKIPSDLDFTFHFRPWHPMSEIRDLSQIDIGIMPLADTDWEKGKCGFKLVQYMALGIPVVASDVGHNCEIVRHGVDGYLCKSSDEWVTHLECLITNPDLRVCLGRSARQRIEEKYSIQANVQSLANILTDASSIRRSSSHS